MFNILVTVLVVFVFLVSFPLVYLNSFHQLYEELLEGRYPRYFVSVQTNHAFSPLCMLELNACRCMIRHTGLKLHLGYLDPHTSNPSKKNCTDSILYINFAMFVFLTAMSRQQSLRTRSVRTGRSRRRRVRWSQWQCALFTTMSDKKTMNYHSKPVLSSHRLKLHSRILFDVVWNSSELKL